MAMRAERAARREQMGNVRLQVEQAEQSGKLVFEAEARHARRTTAKPVVRDFSTRVMRGDRIGLIGPNGAGKTTLLRMLLGELTPDDGEVRRGANVQIAYYDQQREQLDPERTVFDTVGEGNDTVTVERPHAPRPRLPARFPVLRRARAVAGEGAVGRRAQPPAAGAAVHAAGQRARARRADQRSRSRDARAARGAARRVAGHAAARQPRSRVPRQRRHQHVRLRGRRPRAGICRRLRGLGAAAAGGEERERRRGEEGALDAEDATSKPVENRRRRRSRRGARSCRSRNSASSTDCRRRSKRSKPSSARWRRESRRPNSTRKAPRRSSSRSPASRRCSPSSPTVYARWGELDARKG